VDGKSFFGVDAALVGAVMRGLFIVAMLLVPTAALAAPRIVATTVSLRAGRQ
jgi:hypothetical protein